MNLASVLVYLYKDETSFHNEFIVNSQQLLYINLGIGLFFVLYFFFYRTKSKQPTRLNLRAKSSDENALHSVVADEKREREAKVAAVLEVREAEASVALASTPAALPQVAKAPELRVFFVYNAHEWECHDVLGLTRGASLQEATEKYQHLIKTSDSSTFPFYEAAYQALLQKRRR